MHPPKPIVAVVTIDKPLVVDSLEGAVALASDFGFSAQLFDQATVVGGVTTADPFAAKRFGLETKVPPL